LPVVLTASMTACGNARAAQRRLPGKAPERSSSRFKHWSDSSGSIVLLRTMFRDGSNRGLYMFNVLLVGASLLDPVQAATWAVKKTYNKLECTGSILSEDRPRLVGQCVLRFRGDPDKTKWLYVKDECGAGQLTSTCYSDAACTVKSTGDDVSLCPPTPVPFSCNRSVAVTCNIDKEVVTVKLYAVPPNVGDCLELAYVGDRTYPIGLCYSDGFGEYFKATCSSKTMVVKKYGSDSTCAGEGTSDFTMTGSCKPYGPEQEGMGKIKTGCGITGSGAIISSAVTVAATYTSLLSILSIALPLTLLD